MVDEGADLLDIGGESTRPGHVEVDADEEIRASSRSSPRSAHALPGHADQRRHDEAGRRGGGPRGRRRSRQRHLGRRRGRRLARVAAERRVPLVLMHNRAEARYDDLVGRGRRGPRGGDRAGRRGRRRREKDHRRPGIRLRQDGRSTTSTLLRELGALRVARPADPARHVAEVDPRQGPRPAGRRATRGDARDDGPRDRRPAPTSSASTTSGPTSARRGSADAIIRGNWRASATAEGAHRERPDRPREHAVPGSPRLLRPRAAVPQPFEVDVELLLNLQPAGLDDSLPPPCFSPPPFMRCNLPLAVLAVWAVGISGNSLSAQDVYAGNASAPLQVSSERPAFADALAGIASSPRRKRPRECRSKRR